MFRRVMTRRSVKRFLVVYFAVVWAAMALRIDRYPLTWAPMYSRESGSDTNSSRIVDKERLRQGLRVTRRDGSTDYVSKEDLNITRWHFWRLYYQRVFGSSPNKFDLGNANVDRFNRWIRGLGEDEPVFQADWEWRVLRSLNRTLGLEPEDPRFIVKVEADYQRRTYWRSDPSRVEIRTKERTLEWRDDWEARWREDRD
jgi:hypothetical protein